MEEKNSDIKTQSVVHEAFEIGIFLKGFDGVLEIIGGFFLLVINPLTINKLVLVLTQHEISEDSADFIANLLISAAHNLSVSSQLFFIFYLFSHGAIKIFLVVSLWRKKLWAYPAAIIFFLLFIFYQINRYTYTHSTWLIYLTIFDIFIIVLTWLEYKNIKKSLVSKYLYERSDKS
jgi:uncharacterized membrane protein